MAPNDPSALSTRESAPGWASRLLVGLGMRTPTASRKPAHTRTPASARSSGRFEGQSRGELQAFMRSLIAEDRYVFVLLNQAADKVDERSIGAAWDEIGDKMALVPGGIVPVVRADGDVEPTDVAAYYLDRFSVTNQQFQRFVQAGCYDALEFWPREIWPGLMRFTDRTGKPGPRTWEHGTCRAPCADHPVVGVCWYEALAYARWVGKRLPTTAEWQKAAGWPEHLSGGSCTRYPWGDVFSEGRANLWSAGLGRTAPVNAYPDGATLNGIYQMSGNVWEWLDDPLEMIPSRPDETFCTWKPLRRIVGGAFDTYMPSEATNQFVTGQPDVDRRGNIGFRCAVTAEELRCPPSQRDASSGNP